MHQLVNETLIFYGSICPACDASISSRAHDFPRFSSAAALAAAAATVLRANAVKCSPTHSLPLSVSSSSSPELGLRKNTWIGSGSHQLRKIAAVDSLHAAGSERGRGTRAAAQPSSVPLSIRVLPSVRRRQNKSGAGLRAPRTHSLTRGKGKSGTGGSASCKKRGSKFIVP